MVYDSTDYRDDGMPLGGTGASGIGREGVGAAMLEMTEPKTVVFSGRQSRPWLMVPEP